MNIKINIAIILLISIIFSGCAHKISINPDLEEIRNTSIDKKFNANVGYYISIEDKMKEVITNGGGGDKVKYTPYKDTEAALNTVLSKVFNKVYALSSLDNNEYIESKNIKYIFIPTIHTSSSSDSMLTWPPTKFSVELKSQATDTKGKEVWFDIIYVDGYATFDEFKSNFSLSSQRATEKAFKQMLVNLKETNKFGK